MTALPARSASQPDAKTALAYAEYGSRSDARDRAPLVLLHSLGTDHTLWEPCMDYLSDRWVLAPDTAGHGASSGQAGFDVSVQRWVDDLDDLLTALDAPPVVLVGVSMGGMQAVAYTATHPDRVSAVIVADSFARLDPEISRAKIDQQRDAVTSGSMAAVADQYVANTFNEPWPAGAELVRKAMAALQPEEFLATVEATFGIDIEDLLPRVNAPALVLWGDRDTKAPRSLSEHIADGIAGARMAVIPQAGHLANIDNPAAFVREVTDFLDTEGL